MHGQKHATKDTIKYAGFVSEFQVNIINMSAHYMCGATHVLKYDKTMCWRVLNLSIRLLAHVLNIMMPIDRTGYISVAPATWKYS